MLFVEADHFVGVMGLIELGDHKGISSGCLTVCELLSSYLEELSDILLGSILFILLIYV